MDDPGEWIQICSVSGMTTAKIITGRLTADGIPSRLQYEAAGIIYAVTVDGLGEVGILVPAPEQERARAILAHSYDDGDLDWEKGLS